MLIFAISAFGQYVAPAEDTVVIVGGLGTQNNKNTANGGGATKVVWDAGSPSDFIEAVNGGTITSSANAAFDYGNKTISVAGIGSGVTVGTLCYLDDGAAEASFYTGRYKVTTVAANVLTFANINLSGVDTDQANGVTCNVGGALDSLQNALDKGVNDATSYSRYIYDNIATETIGAIIDVDTNTGTASIGRIYIIGYNSTLAAEAEIVITTTTNALASLIKFYDNMERYIWKNIDFNGGGTGKGVLCVDGTNNDMMDYKFIDCKFHNATSWGVDINCGQILWANCEFYANGIDTTSGGGQIRGLNNWIIGCSFHDNADGDGLLMNSTYGELLGSFAYDNSVIGFNLESLNDYSVIKNNTSYNNGSHGFRMDTAGIGMLIMNNASVGNTGVGFEFDSDFVQHIYFGYNLSNVNGGKNSSHIGAGLDATFADFGDGNNVASTQTPDQLFKTIPGGAEDFTPETGSNLIDNALDAGTK